MDRLTEAQEATQVKIYFPAIPRNSKMVTRVFDRMVAEGIPFNEYEYATGSHM